MQLIQNSLNSGVLDMKNSDWILQVKETRRTFGSSTWVPLRELSNKEQGDVKNVGYDSEFFGCGSVAFPPEQKERADGFDWIKLALAIPLDHMLMKTAIILQSNNMNIMTKNP